MDTVFNSAAASAIQIYGSGPVPAMLALPDPRYAKVMSWQFAPLLDRLMDKEAMTAEMAGGVFADVKRFLYLCGTKAADAPRLSPPEVIDLGWHHFMLFTREYAAFCQDHFGQFVHHTPFTRQQRAHMVQTCAERVTVQNAIDLATEQFGVLSPNWYAVGYDAQTGALRMGCSDCAGSTNCGGNDPPCC